MPWIRAHLPDVAPAPLIGTDRPARAAAAGWNGSCWDRKSEQLATSRNCELELACIELGSKIPSFHQPAHYMVICTSFGRLISCQADVSLKTHHYHHSAGPRASCPRAGCRSSGNQSGHVSHHVIAYKSIRNSSPRFGMTATAQKHNGEDCVEASHCICRYPDMQRWQSLSFAIEG